jgi:Ca-activated chloride channel family protein
MMPRALRILLLGALCLSPAWGQPADITNTYGGIKVRIVPGRQLSLRSYAAGRAVVPGEVTLTQHPDRVVILAKPADGARVDVEVDIPYGLVFRARTAGGPIFVEGLVAGAALTTETGDVHIRAPWQATRFKMESWEAPQELLTPKEVKFSREWEGQREQRRYRITDRHNADQVTYGSIQVTAKAPGQVELIETEIHADSPIKMPWQAREIVESLLVRTARPSKEQKPRLAPAGKAEDGDTAIFRLDVRLVNLTAAVTDSRWAPIQGLSLEDFEVLEDGVRQQLRAASSEEAPFHLALLLDLSGSTQNSRDTMQECARRFIGIARPQDLVALYALANNHFHVISRLTTNRAKLVEALNIIPKVSGGSPVYDSIALAYAEEFRQLPNERNALIAITDGVDNQIYGQGAPSSVSFEKLYGAAARMQALIYPVLLDPFTVAPAPAWAKKARYNMELLAQASGGRLFHARSIRDLEPVYGQVEEELRSVYTIGYSPSNQDFKGLWRKIEVKVKRPGTRVRTRPGYYAR